MPVSPGKYYRHTGGRSINPDNGGISFLRSSPISISINPGPLSIRHACLFFVRRQALELLRGNIVFDSFKAESQRPEGYGHLPAANAQELAG